MDEHDELREEILIARAQCGDGQAFLRLVERYHGRLLYYIRRLAGTGDQAEDILQNVWLHAIRQIGRLRCTEAFAVWIYRIAHNQAMQALRDELRYTALEETEEPAAPVEEDGPWLAEDVALVQEGLLHLRPEHREVITLRFLEEMSYGEIAAVTGVPPGTVRSRLHYAKRHLKRFIEEKRP